MKLPHVGTDEDDRRSEVVSYMGEESSKGFNCSLGPDPEQARQAEVDLAATHISSNEFSFSIIKGDATKDYVGLF